MDFLFFNGRLGCLIISLLHVANSDFQYLSFDFHFFLIYFGSKQAFTFSHLTLTFSFLFWQVENFKSFSFNIVPFHCNFLPVILARRNFYFLAFHFYFFFLTGGKLSLSPLTYFGRRQTFTFSHLTLCNFTFTFCQLFLQEAIFTFSHFFLIFFVDRWQGFTFSSHLFWQVANESDAIVLKFGLTLQQIMDVVSFTLFFHHDCHEYCHQSNRNYHHQLGQYHYFTLRWIDHTDDESISFLCLKATINWIKLSAVDKIDEAAPLSYGCNLFPLWDLYPAWS